MARITTREADQQIYGTGAPIIRALGLRLGYDVAVYYPGIDAPQNPNETNVYIKVERSLGSKDPLGIEADSGFIQHAEVRYMIYATEEKTDFAICNDIADQFSEVFSRLRCGNSLWTEGARWEDTVESYGRRVYTITISYKYES